MSGDRPIAKSVSHRTAGLLSVAAFAGTIALWRLMLERSYSPFLNAVWIVGTLLLVFPTVWVGRRLLDINPTAERAAWVTAGVHAILVALFGIGIIKAIQTGGMWRGVVVPVPRPVAIILVYLTGAAAVMTVVNLALKGLGAPFAVALSRRLATDWLYARTRNPMVLATLAWLVAVGLWLQSALFVVWVLVLAAPAWIVFLKAYEERELEIRFGHAYRAYKETTPFLWPRNPRRETTRVATVTSDTPPTSGSRNPS
jgi:protein-S-isoprenylcysteine O-methyltransferase Ste14